MERAIITVGLGFGDEGKGATVDYLVRQFDASLVIRYCGGSQAAHNVQLPDGRRHTFSQFGAGTLNEPAGRVKTWLGPNVIIDPPAMLREAQHLQELGVPRPTSLLSVHPSCLVATVWHRTLNRLREMARGDDVHGSCGLGMGETRAYWLAHGEDAVFAADLLDQNILHHKLELLRQRALLDMQELIGRIDNARLLELDYHNLSTDEEALRLRAAINQGVTISAQIPDCETAIFEGAQGVLLDEYRGFPPYTTWSTVTDHHAWDLIGQMAVDAVAVLGITRAYTTRHGAGPLPTWSEELTSRLEDPGNPFNRWQGSLKCGWLDLPLLGYAARSIGSLDGIVVNHLDQLSEEGTLVCDSYKDNFLSPSTVPNLTWQTNLTERLRQAEPILSPASPEQILQRLGEIAPVVMKGFGPTRDDRDISLVRFRIRNKEDE
jgi:adenylosuccinate synthase